MFSREASRQLKAEFWTAFGIFMRQHEPQGGPKIKWVNYQTGVKGIHFRMDADQRTASVAITLEQADPGIRALFFEQWQELETMLHAESGAEWTWQAEHYLEDGRCISRISREMHGLSVYDKTNWTELFGFLESCIVPLDEIWGMCQDVFKDLAD
ncbi:MAG: DUF4268 domain-containing protein [Bacteroidia bacterium]